MPTIVAFLIAVFLDMLGFGMVIADFQLHAEDLGAKGWLIGILLASTFVAQSIASPRWTKLGDRIGHKKLFIACTLLSATGLLIYGLSDSVFWLLVSRIVGGLGAANIALAQAIVVAQSGDQSSTWLARFSGVMSAGLIFGPQIGGRIAESLGTRTLGLAAAGISCAGVLVVMFFPIQFQPSAPKPANSERTKLFEIRFLKEFPRLRPIFLAITVAWFSLALLEGTFARLLRANLGLGSRAFGDIFGFESAISLAMQLLVLGWVLKRYRESQLLPWAYLLQGVGLALFPFAPSYFWLFPCSFIFIIGNSAVNPLANALASRSVPKDRQGELFGTLQLCRSLGFIVGPFIGGALFDFNRNLPYLVAGTISIGAFLITLLVQIGAAEPVSDP